MVPGFFCSVIGTDRAEVAPSSDRGRSDLGALDRDWPVVWTVWSFANNSRRRQFPSADMAPAVLAPISPSPIARNQALPSATWSTSIERLSSTQHRYCPIMKGNLAPHASFGD